MYSYLRIYLAFLLIVLALLSPVSAIAHGGHGGPMQTFTQAVGPYELAITLELPPSAPAPLYIDITPQTTIGAATIAVRAAPRGQSFTGAPVARVDTLPVQDTYLTQLDLDRAGDWDLEVRVDGAQGSGVARIPFTITIPSLPASSIALLAALGGLVLLMITSIMLAGIFKRRRQPVPRWSEWLLGQAMFACLIAAAIFGVQQFIASTQSAQAAATQAVTSGRPHVNVVLHTDPAMPNAGQPLTATLDLSDGSTGLPVDDLVPHHDALMHLVVISEDGAFFSHVHPPRMAPGRYAITLTPDRPGQYTAYVEIQRQDSGVQVIARDFQVQGTPSGTASPPAPGLGTRTIAGMQITVTSSVMPIRAGKQTTFTFHFADTTGPVYDMEPWLGMAGHLIARSADGAIYGHIHALEPMAPGGLVGFLVRYGPDIRFVYTFPQPGRYQLWAQFRRADTIMTVPLTVQVEP